MGTNHQAEAWATFFDDLFPPQNPDIELDPVLFLQGDELVSGSGCIGPVDAVESIAMTEDWRHGIDPSEDISGNLCNTTDAHEQSLGLVNEPFPFFSQNTNQSPTLPEVSRQLEFEMQGLRNA